MNAKAGLLFCELNFSPEYSLTTEGSGPAPPLKQFTDILWLQWLDAAAAAGVDKKNVKYFYRYHIADKNSQAVITEVTEMDGVCALVPCCSVRHAS